MMYGGELKQIYIKKIICFLGQLRWRSLQFQVFDATTSNGHMACTNPTEKGQFYTVLSKFSYAAAFSATRLTLTDTLCL